MIDISRQDNKVTDINESGNVLNFNIYDKYGAGIGRLLEVMVEILWLDIKKDRAHSP
jgi:activator of 2-hydroxyglutaryl-CoA dehydratase